MKSKRCSIAPFGVWTALIMFNALPFIFNIKLYFLGSRDELFFIPVFVLLTLANYMFCFKTWQYVLMQSFVLVGVIVSSYVSTYLYYHNISDDSMTLCIGELCGFVGAFIVVVTTVITAIIKGVRNKKYDLC